MRPALAALTLALALSGPTARAGEAWMLMERHGACVSLAAAAERRPEFRGIADPDALVARLRADGVAVERQEIRADGRRAVLVDAPARGLSLIFVPASACP